jgi:RNA polymerase sigma-70 factor (ECF subfamily)
MRGAEVPLSVRNASVPPSRQFQHELIALIPHLRAFSRVLCRHRDLAEDLAQDALAKAWRSREQFAIGTNLRAWLFTILRHEFYSHKRRAWRETHWDDVKGDRITAPPNTQLWSLELSDLAYALRTLPDTQREALILIGAGGFSYDEAAKICNVPVGTMKSRVARGRAALDETFDAPQTRFRNRSLEPNGGCDNILAQLSTLMPADARSVAYA